MKTLTLSLLLFLSSWNVFSQESLTINLDSVRVEKVDVWKSMSNEGPIYYYEVEVFLSKQEYNRVIQEDFIIFVIHSHEDNKSYKYWGFDIQDLDRKPIVSIRYNHQEKEMFLTFRTKLMSPDQVKAIQDFMERIE